MTVGRARDKEYLEWWGIKTQADLRRVVKEGLPTLSICTYCQQAVKRLVIHHWNDHETLKLQLAMICYKCNSALNRHSIVSLGGYFLAPRGVQRAYVTLPKVSFWTLRTLLIRVLRANQNFRKAYFQSKKTLGVLSLASSLEEASLVEPRLVVFNSGYWWRRWWLSNWRRRCKNCSRIPLKDSFFRKGQLLKFRDYLCEIHSKKVPIPQDLLQFSYSGGASYLARSLRSKTGRIGNSLIENFFSLEWRTLLVWVQTYQFKMTRPVSAEELFLLLCSAPSGGRFGPTTHSCSLLLNYIWTPEPDEETPLSPKKLFLLEALKQLTPTQELSEEESQNLFNSYSSEELAELSSMKESMESDTEKKKIRNKKAALRRREEDTRTLAQRIRAAEIRKASYTTTTT